MSIKWRIIRDSIFLLFSIFLLIRCSSSSQEDTSRPGSATDTSYYMPQGTSSNSRVHIDTIQISDMKFHPDVLMASKGDTVIWINNDMVPHCITEEDMKAWTSLPVPAGASWKRVVTQSSNYYCAIHQVMKGRIGIKDSAVASIEK